MRNEYNTNYSEPESLCISPMRIREGVGGYQNNYGGNNYAAAPAPSYGGYSAPAAAPASDFPMLDSDDSELPF